MGRISIHSLQQIINSHLYFLLQRTIPFLLPTIQTKRKNHPSPILHKLHILINSAPQIPTKRHSIYMDLKNPGSAKIGRLFSKISQTVPELTLPPQNVCFLPILDHCVQKMPPTTHHTRPYFPLVPRGANSNGPKNLVIPFLT